VRKTKIPTLIAIIFLVLGLAGGVYLVQQQQIFRLSASPTYTPNDLRITNVTDSSFSVSWYTDTNTTAFISLGQSPSLGTNYFESDTSSKRIHYITVDDLSPETTYYFSITSAGDEFLNSGIPWSVTTAPTLSPRNSSEIISGQVFTKLNVPAVDVVVYAQIGSAQLLSAKTSKSGNFLLPYNNVRDITLQSYYEVEPNTSSIQLFVQGGPLGIANVQTYPAFTQPIPDIILGESYDYRESGETTRDTLPEAKIELPENFNQGSRFEID